MKTEYKRFHLQLSNILKWIHLRRTLPYNE